MSPKAVHPLLAPWPIAAAHLVLLLRATMMKCALPFSHCSSASVLGEGFHLAPPSCSCRSMTSIFHRCQGIATPTWSIDASASSSSRLETAGSAGMLPCGVTIKVHRRTSSSLAQRSPASGQPVRIHRSCRPRRIRSHSSIHRLPRMIMIPRKLFVVRCATARKEEAPGPPHGSSTHAEREKTTQANIRKRNGCC
jgi:hypothetical protein